MLHPSESPLSRLHRHVAERGASVALVEERVASRSSLAASSLAWSSLTWSELHRRVLDGAAGMMRSGVGPGDVVVIMLPAGVRLVELELATRAAGAVPLMLPEELAPAAVGALLDGVGVRLVVVDQQQRLGQLRHVDVAGAEFFECDDESWGRLRALGAAQRSREPGVVARADAIRGPAMTRTVLALPRDRSAAWLYWPEASGTVRDLTADDVVLLVGRPSDRFATVVRDAHQRAGCTLAWVESPLRLGAALAHVRPTHVFLDQPSARALEELLAAAQVDGVPWHERPQEVLDAAAAVAAEAKVGARGRRLAGEIDRLAPWWGDRMRVLVVDGRVTRTVTGLAAGLGLEVGRVSHVPATPLDLATRPRRGAGAPAPARVPAAVPAGAAASL